MPTVHELPLTAGLQDDLIELRLGVPQLFVTDQLHWRMQRHYRALEIGERSLYDGLLALDVEHPVTVCFEAQPTGEESINPKVTFSWNNQDGSPQAHIAIKSNFSRRDACEKGANRRLSTALWLGVAGCNALGESNHPKLSVRGKVSQKEALGTLLGSMGVSIATQIPYDTLTHLSSWSGLGVGLGIQFLGCAYAFINEYLSHINPLLEKYMLIADDLGKNQRAIRQGFVFPANVAEIDRRILEQNF